jgi:hypothetical protein
MKTMDEMVERYYEIRELTKHPEYVLSDGESDEWSQLCEDLLYEIMKDNKDVLVRLGDR